MTTAAYITERTAISYEKEKQAFLNAQKIEKKLSRKESNLQTYNENAQAGISTKDAGSFLWYGLAATLPAFILIPDWFTTNLLTFTLLIASIYGTQRAWALMHGVKVKNGSARAALSYKRIILGDAIITNLVAVAALGAAGAAWYWVTLAAITIWSAAIFKNTNQK